MRNPHFPRIFESIICVALALPILLYAYAGTFSRYLADDFCVVNTTRDVSALSETLLEYNTWGGRLSQPFLLTSALHLGQNFPAISPLLLLAVWLIALVWLLVEVVRWFGFSRPMLQGVLVALLLLYATLAGTPQIGQSLYWLSAAYAYTAPLPLFAFMLALVFRAARTRRTHIWLGVVGAMLGFVVGSFAEPVVTVELMSLCFLFAAFWLFARANKAVQAILAAQIVGALVALVLILVSPGNAIREVNFEASPSVLHTVITSFVDGIAYLFLFAPKLSLGAVLGSVGFGALFGLYFASPLNRLSAKRLLLILLAWLIAHVVVSAAFMAPGIYATNAPPPARSLIVLQFDTVIMVLGVGYLLGVLLHRQMRRPSEGWRPLGIAIAAALVLIAPLMTTIQFSRETQLYARFAREWDRNDQLLRAASATNSTSSTADDGVIRLPPFTVDVPAALGLDSLTTDSDSVFNQCVATYYEVPAVAIDASATPAAPDAQS